MTLSDTIVKRLSETPGVGAINSAFQFAVAGLDSQKRPLELLTTNYIQFHSEMRERRIGPVAWHSPAVTLAAIEKLLTSEGLMPARNQRAAPLWYDPLGLNSQLPGEYQFPLFYERHTETIFIIAGMIKSVFSTSL